MVAKSPKEIEMAGLEDIKTRMFNRRQLTDFRHGASRSAMLQLSLGQPTSDWGSLTSGGREKTWVRGDGQGCFFFCIPQLDLWKVTVPGKFCCV